MQLKKMVAMGLIALGAMGVAYAGGKDEDGERVEIRHKIHGPGPHRAASLEFAAMHNIMVELLSAKTGKTTAEIDALWEKGGPHSVAETLKLSEDDMKPLFQQAHRTLVDRALAANLITAAQAEQLRQAKIELRHKRH